MNSITVDCTAESKTRGNEMLFSMPSRKTYFEAELTLLSARHILWGLRLPHLFLLVSGRLKRLHSCFHTHHTRDPTSCQRRPLSGNSCHFRPRRCYRQSTSGREGIRCKVTRKCEIRPERLERVSCANMSFGVSNGKKAWSESSKWCCVQL